MWFNALIESAGGHDHRREPQRPRTRSSWASTRRPGSGPPRSCTTSPSRGRRAGLLDRRARTPAPPSFESAGRRVHGQLARSSGAQAQTKVEAGTLDAVGARRLRLGALPAGRRGHAVRPAATAASTSASRRLQQARRPRLRGDRVHHQRREPGVLLRDQRQPGRPYAAVYDDPEVQKAFPMADVIRESLEPAAPRPQTPVLQRGLRRPAAEYHPPARSTPSHTGQRRPT